MMRLATRVAVVMVAFAANSVLNRVAVDSFGMAPLTFATLRVAAGAVTLLALVALRGGWVPDWRARWPAALALTGYMTGFSLAYVRLDAGLGALILFGVIQVVMFAVAVRRGQAVPPLRWVGAAVAMLGLALLLWPGAGAMTVPLAGTVPMVIAGLSWAAYTLIGQGARDALGDTAGNFVLCLPLVLAAWVVIGIADGSGGTWAWQGTTCAVIAGAVTSGLGYALWYRVLPQLATTVAGIAQLSVPVIAVAAGVAFLAEPLSARLLVTGACVIGGIALSVLTRKPAP